MLSNTISVNALSPKKISTRELISLCQSGKPDGQTYIYQTTTTGSVEVKLFPSASWSAEACKEVTRYLGRSTANRWPEEYIVICNFPCYIVTENGSVINKQREIIIESVYESAGEKTLSRFLGVDLPSGNLDELIGRAGRVDTDKICAAFFCRWSRVYFHTLSECMVQDTIFQRVGIRPHLHYLGMQRLRGLHQKFLDLLQPNIELVGPEVIEVPRAVFSTVARRHAALGPDFIQAIEAVKTITLEQAANLHHIEAPPYLYVSRLGESARPMTNEAEVAAIFAAEGYQVVYPQKLSLIEQAKMFSNAAVVVGPHGSGLINAAFAPRNGIMFELRGLYRNGTPDMNDAYRRVSAIMGLQYGFHIVKNALDSNDWTLPPDSAVRIARSLRDA